MKLLFVIPHPIDPPDRGNKHHTLNLLRVIAKQHDIDIIAFDDGDERSARGWERVTAALPRVRIVLRVAKNSGSRLIWEGLRSLLRFRPVAFGRYRRREVFDLLDSSSRQYDAVCFDMFMTAEGRAHCRGTPGLLLVTDAYSMAVHRARVLTFTPLRRLRLQIEEWLQRRFECAVYRTFDRLLVVSRVDIEWLASTAPGARCEFVPVPVEASVVDAPPVRHERTPNPTICCWAGVRNEPIARGVRTFVEEAWPRIRASFPAARCVIWGSTPHGVLQGARSIPGVTFIEYVDDWIKQLREATVVVYPQRCGSGVQTKMQSAMALGLPCVLTPETRGGLPAVDGTTCLVRDSSAGFAAACTELLADPSLRARIGAAARSAVLSEFDATRVAELFIEATLTAIREHRSNDRAGVGATTAARPDTAAAADR